MKLSLEGADKHKFPCGASFHHQLLEQQSGCQNDPPGRHLNWDVSVTFMKVRGFKSDLLLPVLICFISTLDTTEILSLQVIHSWLSAAPSTSCTCNSIKPVWCQVMALSAGETYTGLRFFTPSNVLPLLTCLSCSSGLSHFGKLPLLLFCCPIKENLAHATLLCWCCGRFWF